jgi:superfamily I DNA/RNA helicase
MVGDMQQAIFGFRHPQKVNVWDWWHERMLDYAAWVELPINYRSSQAVVAALNKINAAFIPRVDGKAVEGAPQGSVTCTTGRSESAMFTAMATKAAGWADDVAILCRTNEQAGAVARFLEGEGMSVKKRRKDAPERVPARLWAALSVYIKPESDWRVSRLLKLDRLDEVDELSNRAAKEMKPLVSYLYPDLLNAGKQREAWPQWMDVLGVPKAEQSWFYERVGEHWQEMTWDRILLRLFEAVSDTEEGMGITVITIHAAKGREWRHVMVPFCDDKTFRSDQEEERIFFVGASRAISDLAFFYAETLFDPWTNQRVPVNICKSLKTLLALDSERDTVRPLPENPTARRTKQTKKTPNEIGIENSSSSPKNLL